MDAAAGAATAGGFRRAAVWLVERLRQGVGASSGGSDPSRWRLRTIAEGSCEARLEEGVPADVFPVSSSLYQVEAQQGPAVPSRAGNASNQEDMHWAVGSSLAEQGRLSPTASPSSAAGSASHTKAQAVEREPLVTGRPASQKHLATFKDSLELESVITGFPMTRSESNLVAPGEGSGGTPSEASEQESDGATLTWEEIAQVDERSRVLNNRARCAELAIATTNRQEAAAATDVQSLRDRVAETQRSVARISEEIYRASTKLEAASLRLGFLQDELGKKRRAILKLARKLGCTDAAAAPGEDESVDSSPCMGDRRPPPQFAMPTPADLCVQVAQLEAEILEATRKDLADLGGSMSSSAPAGAALSSATGCSGRVCSKSGEIAGQPVVPVLPLVREPNGCSRKLSDKSNVVGSTERTPLLLSLSMVDDSPRDDWPAEHRRHPSARSTCSSPSRSRQTEASYPGDAPAWRERLSYKEERFEEKFADRGRPLLVELVGRGDEAGVLKELAALRAQGGEKEVVQAITNREFGSRGSMPALHRAAARGRASIIALLLAARAHPDSWDDAGNTPLHFAADLGHARVARVLVDHGARTDLKNNFGTSVESNTAENSWDSAVTKTGKMRIKEMLAGTFCPWEELPQEPLTADAAAAASSCSSSPVHSQRPSSSFAAADVDASPTVAHAGALGGQREGRCLNPLAAPPPPDYGSVFGEVR